MTAALVLTRLLQFLAAAAVIGSALFQFHGAAASFRRDLRLAAAAGAVGALGWLMAQAGVLYADWRHALDPAAVWSVVTDTGFGAVAALRLVLFVAALHLAFAPGRLGLGLVAVVGAGAAASFAWTGHGGAQEGLAGTVHAAADVVHLLAASLWIGALFVLARLARGEAEAARAGLVAFSGIGPAVVALLVLTGAVNGWFLIGPDHLAALFAPGYGGLLSLKLILFAAMLGLAGVNRWVLTPRLAAAGTLRAVRLSVLIETGLGALVLACVAWMGTLAPPAEG